MIDLNVDRQKLHALWDEILDSSHYTEGKMVRRFEEEVENYYDMHAVAVSNCGAGLYALYSQLHSRSVALPNNTFFATGGAAQAAGLKDIGLIDTQRGTPNVGLHEVKIAAGASGSTVVITHVGGWVTPEYPEIAEWCKERGIVLIEDAAHAIGVKHPYGAFPGSLGMGAVFSLYPTKAMPVGEGGVVVTPHKAVAEQVRAFRNYGKYQMQGSIHYTGQGMNLRMDEWTAAVAYLQMKRLPEILERRQEDAARLMKIMFPHPCSPKLEDSNWYKYLVEEELGFGLPGQTGMIYRREDQLAQSMKLSRRGLCVDVPNSQEWANSHRCVIVGEADPSSQKSRWELFTS